MDLSNKRDTDVYAKVAPRAYRSLHRLHEKTNSSSNPSMASNTKPTFSYKKGEQPSFSFLSQLVEADDKDEDPSSDYGAGWMDDLPSPSALIQTSHGMRNNSKESVKDNDSLGCEDSYLGLQGNDDDMMEGSSKNQAFVNDSHEDLSTVFVDGTEENMGSLGPEEAFEVSQYFNKGPAGHNTTEEDNSKLSMSTDSPEKPSSPPIKRKTIEAQSLGMGEADSNRASKRIKHDEAPEPATNDGNEAAISAPTIKPGHPDWVYEFDPAFVAEWEPYVEFV